MRIGAILAGASEEVVDRFGECGRLVGVAFQVRDDVFDLMKPHEKWGKPMGKDIAEGKRTLMIAHALSHASSTDRGIILKGLGNSGVGRKQTLEIISILKKYGSIDYANSYAKKIINRAKRALDLLEDSDSKRMILAICDIQLGAISYRFVHDIAEWNSHRKQLIPCFCYLIKRDGK